MSGSKLAMGCWMLALVSVHRTRICMLVLFNRSRSIWLLLLRPTSFERLASSSPSPKRHTWAMASSATRPAAEPVNEEKSNEDEDLSENAGARLVDVLVDELDMNAISAMSLCLTCVWANKASAKRVVKDFALRPNAATSGHHQRKVDKTTALKLETIATPMYKVPVPVYTKHDHGRSAHNVLLQLPHEELGIESANPKGANKSRRSLQSRRPPRNPEGMCPLAFCAWADATSHARTPCSKLCCVIGTRRRRLLAFSSATTSAGATAGAGIRCT